MLLAAVRVTCDLSHAVVAPHLSDTHHWVWQTEKRGYEVENKCFRVNLLRVSLECVKKYMYFNLITK